MADRSAGDAGRRRGVELPLIGWREWVGLPELGVGAIKAKVDTGALSSALHALDVERFRRGGKQMVRFKIPHRQRDARPTISAEAEIRAEKRVRSSSGLVEARPMLRTLLRIGGRTWLIDLTLSRRDAMGFRLLLGRSAVRGKFVVDPGRSYLVDIGSGTELAGC